MTRNFSWIGGALDRRESISDLFHDGLEVALDDFAKLRDRIFELDESFANLQAAVAAVWLKLVKQKPVAFHSLVERLKRALELTLDEVEESESVLGVFQVVADDVRVAERAASRNDEQGHV